MVKKGTSFAAYLYGIVQRKKIIPNKLAKDLGISHSTVSRWLSGRDFPSIASCKKLASYLDTSLEKILGIAGYTDEISSSRNEHWPEFREYARAKYPNELDDDIITMVEDLIERRRASRRKKTK